MCGPSRWSALWRGHLATDFACGVLSRVNVDVPLASAELFRLVRRQRRVAFDRAFGRRALVRHPKYHRAVLAGHRRPVKMGHRSWTREVTEGDRPRDDPRVGIVGQLRGSFARGLHGRNLLSAGQRNTDRHRGRQGHPRPTEARHARYNK